MVTAADAFLTATGTSSTVKLQVKVEGCKMGEHFSKIIKVSCSAREAACACKSALSAQKMQIKSESIEGNSFSIKAAEKTNWLSTNWPAKVDITGVASRDTVVITLSLGSTLTSITQAGSNTNKLELIASNIKALLS